VPIVHESNSLRNLSGKQLGDIYRGRVRNWTELGGPDRPLIVVAKKKGRSTREIWDAYFELETSLSSSAHLTGANLATLLFVAADSSAIGYVSEGTVTEARKRGIRVRALTIDGRPPGTLQRADGKALARELNLVTRRAQSDGVRRVVVFMRSEEGLAIIRRHGFLPSAPLP